MHLPVEHRVVDDRERQLAYSSGLPSRFERGVLGERRRELVGNPW
jgi:hypothetical protein